MREGWREGGSRCPVRSAHSCLLPSSPGSSGEKGPGSLSAWKPHTHKALKAALMPRLGISYLLARLIIPPSTGARERRHRGWAGEIGLHSLHWGREGGGDKERGGGGGGLSFPTVGAFSVRLIYSTRKFYYSKNV